MFVIRGKDCADNAADNVAIDEPTNGRMHSANLAA